MSGLLGSLSMVALVGLYAAVGRDWVTAAVLVPVALLPAVARARVRLGVGTQALVTMALLAAAALLVRVLPGPAAPFRGVLGPLAPFLAVGSILLGSHRLFLRNPVGGDRVTVAYGFWCLVACGLQRAGLVYVAGCAFYLLLSGAWLRGGRPSWALGRHRRLWALLMAVSAVVAGGLAWVLPRAHAWVLQQFADSAQLGLQDGPLELGSLQGMAQSDRLVARVFGLSGSTLLRGVVYQDYARGRWLSRPSSFPRSSAVLGRGGSVDVQMEPTDLPRFLVPLEAREIALNTPSALSDSYGVLSPLYGASALWVRYEPGPRDAFAPAPPEPLDLQIPPSIQAVMARKAAQWVGEATSTEAKLDSLARNLTRHHGYSLYFDRPSRRDPLVAFVEVDGSEGHCEYFASAMAMLARSVGIPARVVGGYRVSEYNEIGGYHVVRERNAHAWVEAYVQGKGWVSVDATPESSYEAAGPLRTPLLSAWIDALLTLGSGWMGRLQARPSLLAAALVPVLLLILLREGWRRWSKRRRSSASPLDALPPPRPYLSALLAALEHRGLGRPPAEPLEALARRLDEAHPGDEAAALLRRYSALRYGGVGDDDELRRAVERYLRAPR